MVYSIKIPKDRVGAMIGKGGKTLKYLEDQVGAKIEVDSVSGEVVLYEEEAEDSYLAYRMRDVIRAIGRGFPPKKAIRLMSEDLYYKEFDIRDYVGKSKKRMIQVRSRVIGSGGKTRRIIEDLTECPISIKGNTVALIGDLEGLKVASKAVDMLLSGSEHSSVYGFMERKRKELELSRLGF